MDNPTITHSNGFAACSIPAPGNVAGETCPSCWSAVLRAEGAHGRCDACGWIGKCCEG